MKALLFVLMLIYGSKSTIAQLVAEDSVDYYIKNLSWESLFIKPGYASEIILTKDAERLVLSKNRKTVNKLFGEISNEKKTVAIHLILSKMFEPLNYKIEGKYVYGNDSILYVNYFCNKLSWRYDTKKEHYFIEPTAIKKIKDYWAKGLVTYLRKSA